MPLALIIDDSRAIRQILGGAVRDLGFVVIEAGDGREALRALEAMSPPAQFVLVDWNMPVMNGLQFIQEVRSKPEWDSVKLMMVTSVTEAQEMARALLAGADEYVMKPFTKDVLLDKLRLLGVLD